MLVSQEAIGQATARNGSRGVDLGGLRRQLANPSGLDSRSRQRLLDLVTRLARVRALGDEYARVSLSPMATAATDGCPLNT
jgi:hypothetical protein